MFTQLGRRITLSVCVAIGSNAAVFASEATSVPVMAFGSLKTVSAEEAREQTFRWLEQTARADAKTREAVEAVWASDKSTFDKVSESLALGSAEAARLLAEAGDPKQPAPLEVPAHLKDAQLPVFYRSNLALAYARALAGRNVHEEALDVLRTLKPQQVVDPACLLYQRAVSAHALMLKDEAQRAIVSLLEDVADLPARYEAVARLIQHDIDTWKDQDLGWIARKMANIERRLELARGGPVTQKMQREVVARLDEMIKRLEQQLDPNDEPSCPRVGPPAPMPPSVNPAPNVPVTPAPNPIVGGSSGKGEVIDKILKKYGQFGKLPHKERAEMQEALIRELPERYRSVVEDYFKKMATAEQRK